MMKRHDASLYYILRHESTMNIRCRTGRRPTSAPYSAARLSPALQGNTMPA